MWVTYKDQRHSAEREFQVLAEDGVQALENRMQTYLHTLHGTRAFLRQTPGFTKTDLESFVDDLEIATFLPGINGIGFIRAIPADQSDAFVRMAQEDGYPDFKIHPDTDSEERYVIQHIFPIAPNLRAIGLDITFETGRRTAANAARETGKAHLTPKITLVQDSKKLAGFLLLLPHYGEANVDTLGPTDAAKFQGWVYAPFVADNLLAGLSPAQGREFQVEVFDGRETSDENLIYASSGDHDHDGTYSAVYTVERFGRPWTMKYVSTDTFDQSFRNLQLPAIGIIGLLISGMLVALLRNMRLRSESSRELAALRQRQIVAREDENRSLAENTITPVFVLDKRNRVISANPAAVKCFGQTADTLVGRDFGDFVTEDVRNPKTMSHNAHGFAAGGRKLALNLQRNAWSTAEGEERTTAIVRDITAEVTAHEEIRHTKALYDMALQGSRIGVFEVDLETGQSEVSNTWLEIMGIKEDDSDLDKQELFLSRIHPEDAHLLRISDERCINGETPRSVAEYRVRFGEGQWRWMRSDAIVSMRAADGSALKLLGTQTDVTEVRHARNALEASEQQLRQIVTAAPVGTVLLDQESKFISANRAFCLLCGVPENELLANYSMTDFLLPEDIREIRDGIRELIESGSALSYVRDHRLRHVGGEDRWGAFHISWTFNKNAGGYIYIAQIIDVTEQKRVDRLKSEFVSTVSHELRTPLTSIKGAIGLIKANVGTMLTGPNARLIDIAESNTNRLTTIVNDILDLEKISSGEVNFDFGPLDMGQLVSEALTEMEPFAGTHNNTLAAKLPEKPVMVHADGGRLRQVLFNLVSNACKFSDPETEVTVRVEQLETEAIIYVLNRGPGIPEHFKSKIFTAFSQADSSDTRSKGGTGLGLNIARQIVARHNGQMGFESQKEGVTVFWFTCQLSNDNPTDPPPKDTSLPEVNSVPARILHIEPDRDFAEVLASALQNRARIVQVSNLQEAKDRLRQETFDAAVFDWSVFEGEEGDVLDMLRKLQPALRLVSLSAEAGSKMDDRLAASFVKSQAELSAIARIVTRKRPSLSRVRVS